VSFFDVNIDLYLSFYFSKRLFEHWFNEPKVRTERRAASEVSFPMISLTFYRQN